MSITKTLPEQITELTNQLSAKTTELTAAVGKVTELTNQLTSATTALTTEQTAHAETKGKLTAEQSAHVATKGELTAASAKVTKLESEAKTAEQRAVEIAAAQGVTIPAKADADKSASAESKKVLTGIEAVEAFYVSKGIK